jgi:CO/xanthine dehydrogenase Mo-binding subunit
VHESFGTVVAQIAEVKLEDGARRSDAWSPPIDCGIAISPDQIAAQMEGGTCLGLSAALYGAIDPEGRCRRADQLRRLPRAADERGAARGDLHPPLDARPPASASPAPR